MKKRLLGIVSACLLAGVALAEAPVATKDSAPERYTVVPGDTLWGISGRYLKDPWRWPEIWEANKQVYNPHLIYPGDVLLLCRIQGKAVLAVDQGGGCAEIAARIASGGGLPTQTQLPDGTVKLHPKMREEALSVAVPAIPLKDIQRYLNDSRVVSNEELERAPYVISGKEDHVILGADDDAYVRNKNQLLVPEASYGVYRGGMRYTDPDTGEVLGYEAEDIGAGELIALESEVGTLHLKRTTQNVRVGDKLLTNESGRISSVFHPSNPDGVKPGRILRVFGSIASAAQYSVIVVNRGEVDGVKPGHTFALYRRGQVIKDTVSQESVALPSERAGLAMVFRTFSRVSYALILRSRVAIKVGDEIRPPISGD
ncbi:MAG: LysM peptidoglycan-binding domain-containing protein [bacterium]|nr:LysM peptidoglycan-binding domain-containing protein [bacterium]